MDQRSVDAVSASLMELSQPHTCEVLLDYGIG
jgi:hypothetical protein